MTTKPELSQVEVSALPDGAVVDVVWSGGNHGRYEVSRHLSSVWAVLDGVWVAPLSSGTTSVRLVDVDLKVEK